MGVDERGVVYSLHVNWEIGVIVTLIFSLFLRLRGGNTKDTLN